MSTELLVPLFGIEKNVFNTPDPNGVQHSIARSEPSECESETPGIGSEGTVCHRKSYFLLLTLWQTDAHYAQA